MFDVTPLALLTQSVAGGVIDPSVTLQLGGPSACLGRTLNGLQAGFILFLIASGLTIVLGILDVLNLAHGELFALGAYVSVTVYGFMIGLFTPGAEAPVLTLVAFAGFGLLGALVAAAVVGPVGALIEATFLRRVYDRDEVYQLVLTFALLLILTDVFKFGWGAQPQGVSGIYSGINAIPVTELFGFNYPTYNLFVIVVGAVVVTALFYFFSRTRTGRIIRATAIDREMATAIGVDTKRVFTLVFALGAFFAGFAGAIELPRTQASIEMGVNPLVLSFVVIVIGGLGSLRGAFVGAMTVGLVSAWMVALFPAFETAAPFAIMAVVLLLKPEGLFGTWGERA
jgi:branched-chain amino acid transport system permease protein